MRYILTLALLAAGCGGSVNADPPATDSGVDALSVDAQAPAPSTCPAAPPAEGATCVAGGVTDLLCTYGDEPAPWCRTRVVCNGTTSRWQVLHNGGCSTGCPSTAPTVGTACTDSTACAWSDGTMCICYPGPTRSWRCEPPPADTRCPRLAPNLGAACMTSGLSCRYTIARGCLDCSPLGYTATCVAGVWQQP